MPPNRPADPNKLAFQIVGEATGEIESDPGTANDPAAVERGSQGGKKRAASMTTAERSAAARKAALAR
jgi:hypothetical protein